MTKAINVSWVFWLNIKKDKLCYEGIVRGANYFQFSIFQYRVSIGIPWSKPYIEYHCTNNYGKGSVEIERENLAIYKAPGFKVKMPSKKYLLHEK